MSGSYILHCMPAETARSRAILVATTLLIIVLIGSYFVFPSYEQFLHEAYATFSSGDKERMSRWIQQFGVWSPVFIVLATVLQMFLIAINVMLLLTIAVIVYGPLWGSALGILSICVASTVGYSIGRSMGPYTVDRIIGGKSASTVEEYAERYGYLAVVIARLSPFLSNDAISFVAGLLKMNYFKFMAATLAGIVPLTALIAWMAQDMERLEEGLLWVSVISILLFAIYVLYDQKMRPQHN